jgi:hypothetical protein
MRACAFVWLAVGIVLVGAASTLPRAGAEDQPAPLSLSYAHAGLTDITVKEGKLHYVWHTPRARDDGKPLEQGSLENYDRHQIDVWLTDKELGQFRDWVSRHKVFDFEKDYPSAPGGGGRGAAFQSGLTVSRGEKKHSVSWTGDSKIPESLGKAIAELSVLADAVQKSRNK